MWGMIITLFLVLYGLMSYYIGRKGWIALGKPRSRAGLILYFIVLFLFILPFPLAEVGENLLPASLVPWLTIWGGYSMVAVLYVFLLVMIIDLVRLIDRWLNLVPAAIKEHKRTPLVLGVAAILLVSIAVAYGGWNAQNPVVKRYHVAVDKEAGSLKQLHVAMISDIHYGPIIDVERIERLAKMVEELKPDIVLLAGDITDGSLPPGEAGKLASALGKIEAPYGTFAVPGNHDRDLREDDSELMQALKEAGIHILKDHTVSVGNQFQLIGRDDLSRRYNESQRKELKELMKGVDPAKPIILMDHQPVELDQAQANRVDLQLSGHTHNGQIFPANLITGMIYELDWGMLKKDSYHLIVSCGFGTWGPPLRIGNHPEVVSITMNFK